MAAYEFASLALPTIAASGTRTFTHGITGLTVDPPAGNAFVVLLLDSTANGYTVQAIGSTTIRIQQTISNSGTINYLAAVGVRAVQF